MVATLFSVAAASAAVPIAVAAGAGSAATVAGSGLAAALGAGATATASGGIAVAVGAVSATATAASPIAVAVAPAAMSIVMGVGTVLLTTTPPGLLVLGADGLSWDCWRPVLRDFDSKEPRGRLLKDVAADARVVEVRSKTQEGYWPQIWLKNKWQEEFRIDYVQLPGGEIAAHAVRVEP